MLPYAAVRGKVKYLDGVAIALKDGMTVGAEHRIAQEAMERFFDTFRALGKGSEPTYEQVLDAAREALAEARVDRVEIERAISLQKAALKRAGVGIEERIPQVPEPPGWYK